MTTKKKTDSQRIKAINEKFTIVLVVNFFIILLVLVNTMGENLEHLEDHYNTELLRENILLKANISELQFKKEILESELLLCNSLLEPPINFQDEPIEEEIVEEKVKEVDCLVNQMEWNGTHYVPSEWFVKAPICYEVLK